MLRSSRNLRAAERRFAGAIALWASVWALLAAAPATAADEEPCEPIQAPRVYAQLAPSKDRGVVGATGGAESAARMGSYVGPAEGPIVSLSDGSDEPVAQQSGGEALLVLPKRPDGSLARGFQLAADARVADSFWSPVLCATIVRVVGDALSSPYDLVSKLPDGAVVAPNHVYTTAADVARSARSRPSPAPDSYRRLQHGLDRLGIDAARAISTGAGVRVAVLDSAPAEHLDLPAVRIATLEHGPGRAAGVHGTLTTGVIAAVASNGFGIAGVAPAAEVIAIPVCTPIGATPRDSCRLYDLLRGLDLAWKLHAQILNLSLVGPPNPLLERATKRLDDLGAIVVAAAGNEGTEEARYPAAYPSVVGVGAVDADGARYAQSNGGPSVAIWAPGAEVISTVPGNAFAFASGTSFAAAHVSGALAVLIGSGADPDAARRALFQAARTGAARTPVIAPLCGALAQLGHACST